MASLLHDFDLLGFRNQSRKLSITEDALDSFVVGLSLMNLGALVPDYGSHGKRDRLNSFESITSRSSSSSESGSETAEKVQSGIIKGSTYAKHGPLLGRYQELSALTEQLARQSVRPNVEKVASNSFPQPGKFLQRPSSPPLSRPMAFVSPRPVVSRKAASTPATWSSHPIPREPVRTPKAILLPQSGKSFAKITKLAIKTCMYCAFCKSNNEHERVYKSHVLRDPTNTVTLCPVLRRYVCPICKNGDPDKAHTVRYCPYNHNPDAYGLPMKIVRSSGRLSCGRKRRPRRSCKAN